MACLLHGELGSEGFCHRGRLLGVLTDGHSGVITGGQSRGKFPVHECTLGEYPVSVRGALHTKGPLLAAGLTPCLWIGQKSVLF